MNQRLVVTLAAVLGALIILGGIVDTAAHHPYAGNAIVVGVLLLGTGPAVRVRRNLHRMAEHRRLAARADASL